MNVVRYRLRTLTPWVTPPQADSLFGALCWEIVRRQGEADLHAVLERFRKGDPPFIISNAFPGELLPCPLVIDSDGSANRWVTREQFGAIREGNAEIAPAPQPEFFQQTQTMHADRAGGTAYEREEISWAADAPGYFSLYVRAVPEWVSPLRKLLASLGAYGFGRRRSMGRGQFEVQGEAEPCTWLEPMPFESGFVTLSDFVPQESDPTRGCWNVRVKYPKGSGGTSLKGRLIQLEAGACFQSLGRPRRWYGGMIPMTGGAVHYALALAIGIKWPR